MQTMGEFASLTERLALMPDPALQQFAQMHKDDPFSLSLAVSESNRRRKMRTAQQGLAGMQQQPPVAEQEIAQMAEPVMPENVGIGALPAPSMAGMPAGGIAGEEEPQAMAGGGMVAFAHGGDVERYQFGGAILDQARERRQAAQQKVYSYGLRQRQQDPAGFQAAQAELQAAQAALQAAEKGYAAEMSAAGIDKPVFAASPTGTVGRYEPAQAAAENLSGMDRRLAASPQTLAASAPAATTSAAPGAPKPPAAPGTKPAASGAPTTPSLNVESMTAAALTSAGAAPNPFAQAQKEVGEAKVKAAEENVTGLETIQKQYADIFKGRKERLDTREAELGKMKDQGLGLALLQAGAAMMSTPGGLGVALGKGVKVGSEQYAAGVERLRSAQEKLLDARDRLEEVEAQRGELSARELFKARNDVKNVGIAVKEDMIKSNMQMYGVNRETAMKMVDNKIKVGIAQLEAQSRERVAARNPQLELLEKLGAAQPGSALAKGFEISKQEGLIPRLYEQYTKQASDPVTGADFVRKFPTFEVYRAGMGGANQPGITPGLPSNATVRAP